MSECTLFYTAYALLSSSDRRLNKLPRGYCYLALVCKDKRYQAATSLGPEPTFEALAPFVEKRNTAALNQVKITRGRNSLFHARFVQKNNNTSKLIVTAIANGHDFDCGQNWRLGSEDPSIDSVRQISWSNVFQTPSSACQQVVIDDFDEEFSYLHLFQEQFRDEIALRLGKSPSIDSIFEEDPLRAKRISAQLVVSSIDPSIVYLSPGNQNAWNAMKGFRQRKESPTLGPRELIEPPNALISGFCYLSLFKFYCRREVARRLGSYPSFEQVFYLGRYTHDTISGFFTQPNRGVSPWHFQIEDSGLDAWSTLAEIVVTRPKTRLGSDSPSFPHRVANSNDKIPEPDPGHELGRRTSGSGSSHSLESSSSRTGSFSDLEASPLGVATPPLTRTNLRLGSHEFVSIDEMLNRSPLDEQGNPSMDVPGVVTLAFDVGYCYLGLFYEEDRPAARNHFKANPTVKDLLSTPEANRRHAIGVLCSTPRGPSNFHLSYERVGIQLWTEITRLNLEDPLYTVGGDNLAEEPGTILQEVRGEQLHTAQKTIGQPHQVKRLLNLVVRLSLPIFVLFYMCRAIFFSRTQAFATLFLCFVSLISAVFMDPSRGIMGSVIAHQTPFGTGRLLLTLSTIFRFYLQGQYSLLLFFLMGLSIRVLSTFITIILSVHRYKVYSQQMRSLCITFFVWIVNQFDHLLRKRRFQANEAKGDKYWKTMLNLFSSWLAAMAQSTRNVYRRKMLDKYSNIIRTFANATDLPRAFRQLWQDIFDFQLHEVPLGEHDKLPHSTDGDVNVLDQDVYGVFDIYNDITDANEVISEPLPVFPVETRSYQAADGVPTNSCRHLVTKGNIDNVSNLISDCPQGSVHLITAATGTGKSTVIPYSLSCRSDKTVYVVIPTIAAAHSSAQVIRDRFGVKPHVQADSTYTEGNCNIWVVTSKSFVGRMIHNSDSIKSAYAVIFDEMHFDSAENYLFRQLSPRIATRVHVLWCSATFSQSFTLPGDLSYPVVERISKEVTLANIFTSRCSVRGVTPTTIVGRYLVFCASVRDTEKGRAKFNGSNIKTFAICSSNYGTVFPAVEKALKDPTLKTVVVFSTPTLETGVTLPFNYVVDLREQIVPTMTYDPCALSTKRVPVTSGMATQRKGRVGRLFRGIYIAPPVDFSPPDAVSEGDISLAHVYARIFGCPSPLTKEVPFLNEQVLTDSFISNVFATRMDPIAVAGMSTPEGRIFKSFEEFTFPKGADKKTMVFTDQYFPQSLWVTWPSFDTSEWSQHLEAENRTQTGSTVRAPFWDYTVDDKVQIENWQLKVLCYRGVDITDPRYSTKKYMATNIANNIKSKWLYIGERQFQANPVSEFFSGLPNFHWNTQSSDGPKEKRTKPTTDDWARSFDCHNFTESGACNLLPSWIITQMYARADWFAIFCLYLVLFMVILYVVCVYYAYYRIVKGVIFDIPKIVVRSVHAPRVHEREVNPIDMNKPPNPHRPFEKKNRNWMPSGEQIDPEDFCVIDFNDGRPSREVRMAEIDEELDRFFNDFTRPVDNWADDFVTISGQGKGGRTFRTMWSESATPRKRVDESALSCSVPNYPLRCVRASTVSFGPVGKTQHVGYGIIVRSFIFVNVHVLKACGSEVQINGIRGVFIFRPIIAISDKDLAVIQLPPGMAGSSANCTFRAPTPGEEVCLIRFKVGDPRLGEPIPSEISYISPDKTGIFSYSINTEPGDCGTGVFSIKDGALVGIHSLGGAVIDQANFMAPITPTVVSELNRRVAQRSLVEIIDMPVPPNSFELSGTARVAPSEQAKHAVLPLHDNHDHDLFDKTVAGFVEVATLRKHVSSSSKITIDPFARKHFAGNRASSMVDLTDYCPSDLSKIAYWKDVRKFHRHSQALPLDFNDIALDSFRAMSPWIFEEQELIPVSQVYFEVDKTKSSGPRLQGKKGAYMSAQEAQSFCDLISACESIYDTKPSEFVAPIWQVAIKDELRDRDRVLALKTRTFMSAPIETVLGNLRYVSAFNQRFIDHCLCFPSTLGIDKFRGGWDALVTYLGREDMYYFSGDGSRFDSSVSIDHLSLNCHIRCAAVPKRYHKHIRNLYSETVFTPLVMADGVVRLKNTGNPSGSLNTSVDNGMALQATVYYALSVIFGRKQALGHLLSARVRFVTNGDDVAFAIHKSLFTPNLTAELKKALLDCGMSYDFSNPSPKIQELVYLSHGFQLAQGALGPMYLPVLDSGRIVASCLFRKKTDAISTHNRYTSALVHAYVHPKLYPYVLKLVRDFLHYALVDRIHCDPAYHKFFPLFDKIRIEELYGTRDMGSMDETYSHKIFDIARLSEFRTYQMAPLEHERRTTKDDAQSFVGGSDIGVTSGDATGHGQPLQEAEDSGDIAQRPFFQAPVKRTQFNFARNMDPSMGNLFANVVNRAPRERLVVARSTNAMVEQSVRSIRDFFSIDEESDMSSVMLDFLIYYGDNSTSERNPHIFPYIFKEREYSFYDIDKCFCPTPRKFWRAVADVTKQFLVTHPDVIFHWAHMHGFPIKYRQYGFDCADFCTDVPEEARLAIQASKDAALTRAPYNLMRADLKAVGFGGGTVVEQITGSQFSSRGPGRGQG